MLYAPLLMGSGSLVRGCGGTRCSALVELCPGVGTDVTSVGAWD
jgi:hypothetical protein